jgi:hypothetical protein
MSRPVDTIGKIGDYLAWLLPFFSSAVRASIAGGRNRRVLRRGAGRSPRNAASRSAPDADRNIEGAYLDRLGRPRQTERLTGEEDDDYRLRVTAAWEDKQRQGSIPGLKAAFELLGYTIEIWE